MSGDQQRRAQNVGVSKQKEKVQQARPKERPFFLYSEEQMKESIQAVRNGMSVKKAALTFHVPRATLARKIKGTVPEGRTTGPATILTKQEEDLLEKWLLGLCRKGFPVVKRMLLDSVKKTLDLAQRPSPFNNNLPGETWFKAFLKRHPALSLKNAESLTKARAAVSKEGILRWFNEVSGYLKEENVLEILKCPERIYNADESGFQLCPKTGKVLGPRHKEDVYYMVPNNEKEQITVMGCFNANGDTLPPMIIYPYKRLPREVAESVPDDWVIGLSDSGWINSEVFFEYMSNHFNNYLDAKNVQRPVILFVDGHRSHLSPEVSTFCSENQIVLIALHPNSTHLLQPADVSVFRPLKAGWSVITRKWRIDHYPEEVTRKTFAPLLKEAFDSRATSEIVKNGFKATGIYPFDPQNINFDKCVKSRQIQNPFVSQAFIAKQPDCVNFFATLETKIEPELLKQFQETPDGEQWSGEEGAKALFNVWRDCRIEERVKTTRTEEGNTGHSQLASDSATPKDNDQQRPSTSTDIINLTSNNLNKSKTDPPYSSKSVSKESDSISSNCLASTSSSNVEFNTPEKRQESLEIQTPVMESIESTPSTSTSNNSKYGPRKPGSLISPFKTCLFWPKTPEKVTNKRARVLFPAVVSSKKWKEYYDKAEEDKKKKKPKKTKSNKEDNTGEDWKCKKCKNSFNEEKKKKISRKWVECDGCKSTYHFKCIPKSHIQSFGLSESDDEEDITFMCHECAKFDESDNDFEMLDSDEN